jgi:thiosulfate/3-mercaptopyruvate sulfurtransferase
MCLTNEIVAWLEDNRLQPDMPLAADSRALILAAQQGRANVLAYLLKQQPDLSVVDQYGNNALWAACFAEAADCIALLLQAGVDIDYQNPSGATALTYASSSGKYAVVAQLLLAGANPLLTTQDDFSALDLVANRQCLQLLRHAGKALG